MKNLILRTGAVALAMMLFVGAPAAQEDRSAVDEQWNHKIEVMTGPQRFDDDSHYAYSIDVFDAKRRMVEDVLKAEVESGGMGKKGKGSVSAGHPFDLSAFESPEMDFKSTVEHIRATDNARVHLAFFRRKQNINPDDFPKEDKIAKEMMYNLSVALNKAVVRADLEEAQKDLEKMQSDLEKMDRREEKLSDKAGKQADRAIKAQKDVGRLEKKLDGEKDKLESLQMKYGPNPSAKELGKIAKVQKKVEKLKRDIEKKKEDVLDYQKKEAELETSDLPDQRAERKDLVREIDTQKALVEALEEKLAAIR